MRKIQNLKAAGKTAVKTIWQATKLTIKIFTKAAQAAMTTARAARITVEAVITSIKVAISAAKSLTMLTAAAGWTAVLIIVIIYIVVLVIYLFFRKQYATNKRFYFDFSYNL